jgi:hypothetical protein
MNPITQASTPVHHLVHGVPKLAHPAVFSLATTNISLAVLGWLGLSVMNFAFCEYPMLNNPQSTLSLTMATSR